MENNINNLVYKCLVGSRAYGTNLPDSDYDYKGIYIQPKNDILGLKYKEQIEVGKDETYYEIRRFIDLAGSGNPTMLEMLFSDPESIDICKDCLDPLWANREKFITKKCFQSFGGYAVAQIKKAKGLDKKVNWSINRIIRKTPLDFCYVIDRNKSVPLQKYLQDNKMLQEFCGLSAINHFPNVFALYYDWSGHYGKDTNIQLQPIGYRGIAFEDSNDIRLSSIPKDQEDQINVIMSYNKDAYSLHCKEYREYEEWLKNSNPQRRVETKRHGQQIDGKNMLHCIRLLDCAIEIGEKGYFEVKRPNKEYLLQIRKGELDLEEILIEAEEKLQYLNELSKESNLPTEVDIDFKHQLIIDIRKKYEETNS